MTVSNVPVVRYTAPIFCRVSLSRVSIFGAVYHKSGILPGGVHYTVTRLRHKRWILSAIPRAAVALRAREELRHKQASVLTLSSLRSMKNPLASRVIASPRGISTLERNTFRRHKYRRDPRALRPRGKKGFYDPKSRSPSLPAPPSPSFRLSPSPSSSKRSSEARASP